MEFIMFALFTMQLNNVIFKECMSKGRNSNCLYIHKFAFKYLKIVSEVTSCQMNTIFGIFKLSDNVFKINGTFSTFPNHSTLIYIYAGSPLPTPYTLCLCSYFL